MRYDISKPAAPKMPILGKGTECIKILLSQASKDNYEPFVPMFFPVLGAHISGAEFQYPDNSWKEPTGMMANLVANSGDNKGQLAPLVEAICRDFRQHDKEEENKYLAWLQTPYYDREGKLIGIQNRNLVKGALPRFRFPQGAECGIYNLPVLNLLKPGDELYITEGCSDCWAMLSAGHKAIAIPSATLLTKKDVEQLSIINSQLSISFEMFPDNDTPGERLFLQLKEVLPSLVHYQLPPDCKDFSDYYLTKKRKEANHG